jgi:hypothetical protein
MKKIISLLNLSSNSTNFLKNCNNLLAENCKISSRKTLISSPLCKRVNKKDLLYEQKPSQLSQIKHIL